MLPPRAPRAPDARAVERCRSLSLTTELIVLVECDRETVMSRFAFPYASIQRRQSEVIDLCSKGYSAQLVSFIVTSFRMCDHFTCLSACLRLSTASKLSGHPIGWQDCANRNVITTAFPSHVQHRCSGAPLLPHSLPECRK